MRIWGLLAASTVLAFAGCATGGAENDNPPSGSNAKSAPSAKAKAKAKAADGPLKFGQAFTWKQGITVTVKRPVVYKPSASALLGKGAQHVKFAVTLVNKTGKPFDPSLIYPTVQSGNTEGNSDVDIEQGIGNMPQTKLLDGREATFKVGYGVQNPHDIVFELSPDAGIEYKAALWKTQGG